MREVAGERKKRDRRKSPIFWLYALLSQSFTLVSSSIAVCQHLSKKHRPLSTPKKFTISVNVWQTSGMSGKNSSRNIPEKGTGSSGEDVPLILPTRSGKSLIYQVFSIAQTFANISILIISPLNLNGIVEEQTKEMNGLGITLVHSKPNSEDCLKDISKGKFQMMFASAEDCLCKKFTEILKAPEPHSEYNISLIVIYECHMLRHGKLNVVLNLCLILHTQVTYIPQDISVLINWPLFIDV